MNKDQNHIVYFVLALASFTLVTLGYFLVVDNLLTPVRDFKKPYPQFLLEASRSKSPKIIIDSGSNSLHGIVPSIIEKRLKRVTVNVADFTSFPFKQKINRLQGMLQKGDVLVLPLEWQYYAMGSDIFSGYFPQITQGNYSYYYYKMPFFNRLALVLNKIPLESIAPLIFKPQDERSAPSAIQYLSSLAESFNGDKNLAKLIAKDNNAKTDAFSALNTCDDYLFGTQKKSDFNIPDEFIQSLQTLKDMAAASGAKVIFTWPTVVDGKNSTCYESPDLRKKLDSYSDDITSLVQRFGFDMIAEYNDSHYPAECFRDTYYHLKHHCAKQRSEKLASSLIDIAITPDPNYSEASKQNLQRLHLRTLMSQWNLNGPPLSKEIEANDFANYIGFMGGWSQQEAWGRWSDGDVSTLFFASEQRLDSIKITGQYFNGAEQTKVSINGQLVGQFNLQNTEISLRNTLQNSRYIEITLEHQHPTTPASLNKKSKDQRRIKFGIRSITVI